MDGGIFKQNNNIMEWGRSIDSKASEMYVETFGFVKNSPSLLTTTMFLDYWCKLG